MCPRLMSENAIPNEQSYKTRAITGKATTHHAGERIVLSCKSSSMVGAQVKSQ